LLLYTRNLVSLRQVKQTTADTTTASNSLSRNSHRSLSLFVGLQLLFEWRGHEVLGDPMWSKVDRTNVPQQVPQVPREVPKCQIPSSNTVHGLVPCSKIVVKIHKEETQQRAVTTSSSFVYSVNDPLVDVFIQHLWQDFNAYLFYQRLAAPQSLAAYASKLTVQPGTGRLVFAVHHLHRVEPLECRWVENVLNPPEQLNFTPPARMLEFQCRALHHTTFPEHPHDFKHANFVTHRS
jgi:hypothetical protein